MSEQTAKCPACLTLMEPAPAVLPGAMRCPNCGTVTLESSEVKP